MKLKRNPGFKDLVGPLSKKTFFSDYWQKAPMINCGGAEPWTTPILDLNDIDSLIATLNDVDTGWIMLVKDGQNLPVKYLKTEDSFVNLGAIYKYFEKGYTIVLTKVDKRHGPVGLFCRELEDSLLEAGCLLTKNIGANVYLTPKRSKGFPVHYDNHDVFIIQIAGSKVWRIFDELEKAPVKRFETPVAEDTLPKKIFEGEIKKGDVLYIPRGFYHDAFSTDELSLHITVSINQLKWMDLFQHLMEQSPDFRENIPLNFFFDNGNGHANKNAALLTEKFAGLFQPEQCRKAYTELAEKLFGNTLVFPDKGFGRISDAGEITADTTVAKRNGTYSKLVANADEVLLLYPRSGIKLPAKVLKGVEFIHKTKQFKVREIPDVFSAESKITLVKELIEDGFLKSVSHNGE